MCLAPSVPTAPNATLQYHLIRWDAARNPEHDIGCTDWLTRAGASSSYCKRLLITWYSVVANIVIIITINIKGKLLETPAINNVAPVRRELPFFFSILPILPIQPSRRRGSCISSMSSSSMQSTLLYILAFTGTTLGHQDHPKPPPQRPIVSEDANWMTKHMAGMAQLLPFQLH